MKIIHIVPRLPPMIDGVGDFALLLSNQLKIKHKINSTFIVGDPLWKAEGDLKGCEIKKIELRTANSIFNQLIQYTFNSPKIVLLHFVNYGYEKRGCPFWLIDGLKKWKNEEPNSTLIIMFHETYAKGGYRPWTSVFYLWYFQKHLAKRLVDLGDILYTNEQQKSNILKTLSEKKNREIIVKPVFSTIGEPLTNPNLGNRKKILIIFGSRAIRTRVYKESVENLNKVCSVLQIEKIIDIGPRIDLSITNINLPKIEIKGTLDSKEISLLMLTSYAGYMYYDPSILGRSTIFAAYASHGLVPVVDFKKEYIKTDDGLAANEHYLDPNSYFINKNIDDMFFQNIADNSSSWYHEHNLDKHAESYSHMIGHIIKPNSLKNAFKKK